MAPTTVTTIAMILVALGLFALTAYAWLGDWDRLANGRVRSGPAEDEIEAEVQRMRRAIEEYERSQRPR